jgi:mono/diheme cytochrome c family protein
MMKKIYLAMQMAALVGFGVAGFGAGAVAQQISAASGVYAEADAQRGQAAYASRCATCHGRALISTNDAPSLVGEPFAIGWKGKTLGERFTAIKETMPPNNPGDLPDQFVIDVLAFILKSNGFAAGATPLPSDPAALDQILIPK